MPLYVLPPWGTSDRGEAGRTALEQRRCRVSTPRLSHGAVLPVCVVGGSELIVVSYPLKRISCFSSRSMKSSGVMFLPHLSQARSSGKAVTESVCANSYKERFRPSSHLYESSAIV